MKAKLLRLQRALVTDEPNIHVRNFNLLALAGIAVSALAGLTAVPGQKVAAPAIAQLPLTLECKVIYRQHQDPAAIPPAIREKFHPQDVEPDFHGRNRDFHTAYYGEIVSAYILE